MADARAWGESLAQDLQDYMHKRIPWSEVDSVRLQEGSLRLCRRSRRGCPPWIAVAAVPNIYVLLGLIEQVLAAGGARPRGALGGTPER